MPNSRAARGDEALRPLTAFEFRTTFEQEQAMKQAKRTKWGCAAGVLAAVTGLAIQAAQAENVIDEWATVKAPPPPELKAVSIDPASTALIVMDISSQSCTLEKRPRCVATLPKIQKLISEARAKGVFVLYTLAGTSKRTDLVKEIAPLEAEQSLSGAGPDKFVGIDLDTILKGKNVKTLIAVGTRAEGAVLPPAPGAPS